MIGAAIWWNQTRFDLCYITVKLPTLLVPAGADSEILQEFLTLVDRYRKVSMGRAITFRFRPFVSHSRISQLVGFIDDGQGTLYDHSSIESLFLTCGRPLSRGGVISCDGHAILWQVWAIKRACRSSATCEVFALSPAADACLWFQAVYFEMLRGEFQPPPIQTTSGAVLVTPFDPPPTDDATPYYTIGNRQRTPVASTGPLERRIWTFWPGPSDWSSSVLRFDFHRSQYQGPASYSQDTDSRNVYCLFVTDSANAVAAPHLFNARDLERLLVRAWLIYAMFYICCVCRIFLHRLT